MLRILYKLVLLLYTSFIIFIFFMNYGFLSFSNNIFLRIYYAIKINLIYFVFYIIFFFIYLFYVRKKVYYKKR